MRIFVGCHFERSEKSQFSINLILATCYLQLTSCVSFSWAQIYYHVSLGQYGVAIL